MNSASILRGYQKNSNINSKKYKKLKKIRAEIMKLNNISLEGPTKSNINSLERPINLVKLKK